MTAVLLWLIGIFGGATTILSLFLWEQKSRLQKAKLALLETQTADKMKEDAQVLANAQLLTSTAEADYEKAMVDLPAASTPPAKGKLPGSG